MITEEVTQLINHDEGGSLDQTLALLKNTQVF